MSDDLDATRRALDAARAREGALEARVTELGRMLADVELRVARIGDVELERDEALQRIRELEARVAALDEVVERNRRVHEEMLASVSWRVTAPLRRLKR
ncbi:MAG TPA: hypothetical protein VD931_20710 [Baekduia sp.]|nr:hypothetical protein [Baekduia sp.]